MLGPLVHQLGVWVTAPFDEERVLGTRARLCHGAQHQCLAVHVCSQGPVNELRLHTMKCQCLHLAPASLQQLLCASLGVPHRLLLWYKGAGVVVVSVVAQVKVALRTIRENTAHAAHLVLAEPAGSHGDVVSVSRKLFHHGVLAASVAICRLRGHRSGFRQLFASSLDDQDLLVDLWLCVRKCRAVPLWRCVRKCRAVPLWLCVRKCRAVPHPVLQAPGQPCRQRRAVAGGRESRTSGHRRQKSYDASDEALGWWPFRDEGLRLRCTAAHTRQEPPRQVGVLVANQRRVSESSPACRCQIDRKVAGLAIHQGRAPGADAQEAVLHVQGSTKRLQQVPANQQGQTLARHHGELDQVGTAGQHRRASDANLALQDAAITEPVALLLRFLSDGLGKSTADQDVTIVLPPSVASDTATASRVDNALAGVDGGLSALTRCGHPDVTNRNGFDGVFIHLRYIALARVTCFLAALLVAAPVANLTTVLAITGFLAIGDPFRAVARALLALGLGLASSFTR